MKIVLATILLVALSGCIHPVGGKQMQVGVQQCLGGTDLPEGMVANFDAVEDEQLLDEALGEPNKGKLCQGRVYRSGETSQVAVYRAWNSTNPNSKFGQWWAFQEPTGKISAYRSSFEICYQWSPLDKLVRCSLKPGTKIVLGTGQSAECSAYLSYPVSEKQQVFISNAALVLSDCSVFDAVFSWK